MVPSPNTTPEPKAQGTLWRKGDGKIVHPRNIRNYTNNISSR